MDSLIHSLPEAIRKHIEGKIPAPQVIVFEEDDSYSYLLMIRVIGKIACSAIILRCLEENLYPSWDAQNMNSVRLAEKLGYEFDHEYIAYEVDRTRRVH